MMNWCGKNRHHWFFLLCWGMKRPSFDINVTSGAFLDYYSRIVGISSSCRLVTVFLRTRGFFSSSFCSFCDYLLWCEYAVWIHFKKLLRLFLWISYFVNMILAHTHGGQGTTCVSWFSPPTGWAPGIKLRSSGLAANTFTHWAILLVHELIFRY